MVNGNPGLVAVAVLAVERCETVAAIYCYGCRSKFASIDSAEGRHGTESCQS